MYKKITHKIVEEHFDHPIAAELKNKVDNTKPMGDKKSKSINVYDLSPLSQLEKDSINYWAQLSWRIRSLVISITSGDEDIDLLKTRMASDIDNISTVFAQYYDTDKVTTFTTLLNTLTLALVDVITAIKADKDTTDTMKALTDATGAFADFLESSNKSWPSKVVADILSQVENLYIMQTISRIKKEWATGVTAADDAYNIMVVKQDNGDPSFADIFSAGIEKCLENEIQTDFTNLDDYMET